KIRRGEDGRYRISHPRIAQQYRLNVGTIVEETMIKVRLVRSGAGATARATPGEGRPLPHLRGRARGGAFPTAFTGRPLPPPPPAPRPGGRDGGGGGGPTGGIGGGGRVLGEREEYFIEGLTPGDTFVFSGEILRFEALAQDEAYVSRAHSDDPKVPAYAGGKF